MRNPAIDVVSLLVNQPMFMGLPEDRLRQFSGQIREKRLSRGETLFHHGAPAGEGFWIIVLGQIKLAFPATSGNEMVLTTLGAKQSFGEAQMLLGERYPYYAEALTDSLLLRVDRTVFAELRAQAHPLVRGLIDSMAASIQHLVLDIEHLLTHSGAQRVVGYLLRLCPCDEEATGQGGIYTVALSMTKQLLASRLNLTPETLSRIFHELATEGLIHVVGKRITILDLERLRDYGRG